jgi:hypothetical protein
VLDDGAHVRIRADDVREFVILGHHVEVYLRDEDQWRVVVDGQESQARFANPYAAWAAGAAESYRQGRKPGSPPAHG